VTAVHVERRLVDVIRVHAHLTLATTEVELGEEPRTAELIQQLIDHQYWELILHRLLVKLVVVDAKMPSTISLLYHEHRGREC
jgi:hypothetical protein